MNITQTPESDMDTSSDSDSDSVHEAEEGKLLDLDQDANVTNTDQASTEEQNYREIMYFHTWAGHIYRTLIQFCQVLRIIALLHPNNSQWVK